MDSPSTASIIKELHSDLHGKYTQHAAKIERIWRSFGRSQREICIKAGAADGMVLKDPLDSSLGRVCMIIPEINLRDTTEPGSDFLLDLLKHRATKPLIEQYFEGANGTPGDLEFIKGMMYARGLRLLEPFTDCYTMFLDGETYGKSYHVVSKKEEVLSTMKSAMDAGNVVPQSIGELVLQRQTFLFQHLNLIIEDILDEGSVDRDKKQRPKKSTKAALAALSRLTFQDQPSEPTFTDVLASVGDQKADLEDYLDLLSTEPVVLAHAVNVRFFSQPELIPDEKGCRLPVHTDKYISSCFFEAIHNTFEGAAIWDYLGRLHQLLQNPSIAKAGRAIILQDISNTCHLEYRRAQANFKRHVQISSGSKWFKRIAGRYDDIGNARINPKGDLENVIRIDPQLYYMIHLCQQATSASKATDWIKKLSDLHRSFPSERERITEREIDSLCDLSVIVGFIQDLSKVIKMPTFSQKNGQAFSSKLQKLTAELNQLRKQVDLRDFVVPINNLLEPGVAGNALKMLDQFIVKEAGTTLGFLYQDLVEDCFSDLQQQLESIMDILKQNHESEPLPPQVASSPSVVVEQRREKEKTRPTHASAYEFAHREELPVAEVPAQSQQVFEVSASTAEVFTTLFRKSQSRGSVSLVAFQAAMADLGFSAVPKDGSIYTFIAPDTMAAKRPLTVHQPHQSKIEGYRTLILARRLKRVYGWNEDSFRVKESENNKYSMRIYNLEYSWWISISPMGGFFVGSVSLCFSSVDCHLCHAFS
ncbi:hypothetical protein BX600DRAFT_385155 [Xylariales sp. PMI_506]|nr:hypothetical protein BX600DRAFT_385155 [Xylariales sp. PMI_506]